MSIEIQGREAGVDHEADVLRAIEKRILWLSTAIVHHANKVRPNPSKIKVGGHQASSASMVSMMTALWFGFLGAADRVSVKPHASPVLHAINYLLGKLDGAYLTTLRQYGGLQSYPSRTKDPDPVDFSTGSVGIGATATIWSALAHRYVAGHFEVPVGGRQIALVGDAELDEGAIWEAIVDPNVARLGELLWIIDLNRQSLDRVVPDIAAGRLTEMFEAAGWNCVTAKYGGRLQELFARPGGENLRRRIDLMTNEEYQRLLQCSAPELRERLPEQPDTQRKNGSLRRLIAELEEADLLAAVRDLGGHDIPLLLDAYREADRLTDGPSVIFAYTIKGWRLPIEGHPANHSALLTEEQFIELASALGVDIDDPWRHFPNGSPERELCERTAQRLERLGVDRREPPSVPPELGQPHKGMQSTQQAFGRFFTYLDSGAPGVADRVVTVSPDVASSTNLGGWINKRGIWALGDRIDWFADDSATLVRWRETNHGQHIELGIAETSLVGLLGELGVTWLYDGEPLLPVGTVYDPFVGRALEPWAFGIYAGGQSILVGTPSGITLAPEGGAHQSVITPLIGLGVPNCIGWEPAFAQDFEWTFLHALGLVGRPDGCSSYFRLSTRPVDQALASVPAEPAEHERRRHQAIRGGYRLREASADGLEAQVTIAGMGAVMPEVLRAAKILASEGGIGADVVCVTSADLLFRAFCARSGTGEGDRTILDELFPPDRETPIVSGLDGHPHTLSFLGSIRSVPITCLGVSEFGQSGELHTLYERYAIDEETFVGAALDLV